MCVLVLVRVRRKAACYSCRLGFGEWDSATGAKYKGLKISSGKVVCTATCMRPQCSDVPITKRRSRAIAVQLPHSRPTLEMSSKGHPQFEGPRDHRRLIQHVKTLILTWVANCDTQVVLEDNLLGLQKYVSAYACKGAATTEDLVAIYKVLVNSLDNSATVRSLAQRLLLRTVGMVDVPAAAADYILAGGALYHHTRVMRRVGLSGWRVLDVESEREHGKATRETPLDRFKTAAAKNLEKKQKPSTLWEWAQGCNCTPGAGCGSDHAPLFTGAVSVL